MISFALENKFGRSWSFNSAGDFQGRDQFDIEDDRTVLKLYEKFFSDEGYQFQVASSGSEAMQKIDQEKFDLVCLDLRLPDMGGNELQN